MTPATAGVAAPIVATIPEDPGVTVAFTGRHLHGVAGPANLSLVVGDGDVAAARAAALRTVGATPDEAVFMAQVHGGDAAVVTPADRGRGVRSVADAVPAVDALATPALDVALAVLVADSVPVGLVDPGAGVAVAHAGRRGAERGVVAAALRALAPADPGDVVAVVGPAIGGCCYELPGDLVARFAAVPAAVATTTWGTPSIDVRAVVRAQLAAAGVGRVESLGGCTRCSDGRWFSHRGVADGAVAGRQAGLVVRRATRRSDVPLRRNGAAASLESR